MTCPNVTAARLLGLGLPTAGHQGDSNLLPESPGNARARVSNFKVLMMGTRGALGFHEFPDTVEAGLRRAGVLQLALYSVPLQSDGNSNLSNLCS